MNLKQNLKIICIVAFSYYFATRSYDVTRILFRLSSRLLLDIFRLQVQYFVLLRGLSLDWVGIKKNSAPAKQFDIHSTWWWIVMISILLQDGGG